MSEIDRWIEIAKDCNYLPENDLKVSYAVFHIAVAELRPVQESDCSPAERGHR